MPCSSMHVKLKSFVLKVATSIVACHTGAFKKICGPEMKAARTGYEPIGRSPKGS